MSGNLRLTNQLDRCANSFEAGTLVLRADRSRTPIEDIHVGDRVLALDEASGGRTSRRVTHLIRGQGFKSLYEIPFGGELITATENHPFYVVNRGERVFAHPLASGDRVLSADGEELIVEHVAERPSITRV